MRSLSCANFHQKRLFQQMLKLMILAKNLDNFTENVNFNKC